MDNIKEEIKDLNATINTIDIENKDLFLKLSNILENLTEKVEEIKVNQETIEETLEYMDDDLSGIQEELFEEVSLDELEDFNDEYKEIKCSHCKKPVFIEVSTLENNNKIPCPYCNKNIIE